MSRGKWELCLGVGGPCCVFHSMASLKALGWTWISLFVLPYSKRAKSQEGVQRTKVGLAYGPRGQGKQEEQQAVRGDRLQPEKQVAFLKSNYRMGMLAMSAKPTWTSLTQDWPSLCSTQMADTQFVKAKHYKKQIFRWQSTHQSPPSLENQSAIQEHNQRIVSSKDTAGAVTAR